MWPGWRQLYIQQVKCHGDHLDAWSSPVSKEIYTVYIERSLSEVTFDLRQSALKPQKRNTAERLLPFVATYHPAVKKIKTNRGKLEFHRKSASAENNFQNSSNHILQKR